MGLEGSDPPASYAPHSEDAVREHVASNGPALDEGCAKGDRAVRSHEADGTTQALPNEAAIGVAKPHLCAGNADTAIMPM